MTAERLAEIRAIANGEGGRKGITASVKVWAAFDDLLAELESYEHFYCNRCHWDRWRKLEPEPTSIRAKLDGETP